jgi:glycosyltransferase involved in cell wall biosynthesis
MKPLISIITVTYNAEKFIEKTICSILEQNYPDIEYIIIDGASTDQTMEIVKKYKDQHIIWKSEPDNGLYDAMNKGLRLATGDYVWFINAGDTLHSANTVEEMVESVPTKAMPDVIYGETAIVDEQGNHMAMRRLKTPSKLSWRSFKMGMLVCHQSFIAKRTITPEFDLKYSYSSDYEWTIQCLKNAKTIHNSHVILSNFMEGGLSTTVRGDSLKERYLIMRFHYGIVTVTLLHVWFAVRFFFAKLIKGRV